MEPWASMAALLMFETAVFQVASLHTGHSPVVGPSECKLGLSVFRAHLFPSCHSRSHVGSASDVRFSLGATAHAPPGLHRRYTVLREESAKVRGGGMCVCVSLGSLGLVRPCVWLQLHRRLACGAKPCPAFSPLNDSCSVGVGALVSCNSCLPPFPQPPGGREVGVEDGQWSLRPHYSLCACAWVCIVHFW